MNLFSNLFDRLIVLIQPIWDRIIAPIKPLITVFRSFRENTIGIFEAGAQLISDVENEYVQIRDFQLRPQWKNRVIGVPHAIETITEFAAAPQKVITAIRDLIEQIRSKLQPARFEIDELEGIEDLRGVIRKFGPRIAKGFEKVLGAVTLIVDALGTIRATIDDLQTIVDEVRIVREGLENLDGLFLTQKNSRKVVRSDIGALHLRVGKLHQL